MLVAVHQRAHAKSGEGWRSEERELRRFSLLSPSTLFSSFHSIYIIPLTGMTPFGRDQVGLLYGGSNVAHKWPRTVQIEHFWRWALWERERLVSLTALDYGEFVSAGLILSKPQIFINARTEMSGRVVVELLDAMGEPVGGHRFEDSDPIIGNHTRAVLTWRGSDNLADQVGKKIYLGFRMFRAKLFSLASGA